MFILVFLANLVSAIAVLGLLVRAKSDRVRIWLRRIVIVDVVYFLAIVVTSVTTPQRIVATGQAQCFDDWCITVTGSERSRGTRGDSVRVNLTLSSQARGIAQGERDVAVELIDGSGNRYRPTARDADVPLSFRLPPSGSQPVSRLFVVPSASRALWLLVVHDWFPHCCIIGDRESLLHKAAVVRL